MTTPISASMVKELREQTGAGMMDCKAALNESGGNLEAAVDWLRKKGLSKAAKKAGRVAAEGLVGIALAGNKGIRGRGQFRDRFRRPQRSVPGPRQDDRRCRARPPAPTSRKFSPRASASITIADAIADTIAKVGENMTLRRAAELSVGKGTVASYVHSLGEPTASAASALSSPSNSAGNADELKAFGRLGGDAYRLRQSAGDRSVRASIRQRWSGKRTCSPTSSRRRASPRP